MKTSQAAPRWKIRKNCLLRVPMSLLLISFTFLMGCSEDETVPAVQGKPEIQVKTQVVRSEPIVGTLRCFGVLEALNEVQVNVDFAAPVSEIMVHEGQQVKEGQELLRFDTAKLKLRVDQTKAALSQEESTLENLRVTKGRIEKLFKKGTESRQSMDDALAKYKAARGRVEEMKNVLRLMQRDLERSVVKSPIKGIVNKRMVEMGQSIAAHQPLFELEATGNLNVSVFVGEEMIPHLGVGSPALIKTVKGEIQAKIFSISAKADPQTGNFGIKLLVENGDGALKPGMTADVELETYPMENRFVVPHSSLVASLGRYVIYQCLDGRAVRTEVDVSMDFGDQLVITRGLAGGETIIVAGADRVEDGAKVEVSHE